MLRFLTAGESHGPCLTTLIDGLPAGLILRAEDIDADLARRQQGYGRGGRQRIERDHVRISSGVAGGSTQVQLPTAAHRHPALAPPLPAPTA